MINKTIWLDHQHAYIFEFNPNQIIEKSFVKKLDTKLIEPPKKFMHAKERQKVFYHLLASEIGNPDQLLILGPGIAKEEFKHYCESHNYNKLSKNIISSIPMKSNPRRSEILKISKKYFDNEVNHKGT